MNIKAKDDSTVKLRKQLMRPVIENEYLAKYNLAQTIYK